MADAVKKYPSRIRYEENNPTVSFRVSIKQLELLNEVRDEQGVSFKDLILVGAKSMETDKARRLMRIRLGKCSTCGKPLVWNLLDPAQGRLLHEHVSGLICGGCRE